MIVKVGFDYEDDIEYMICPAKVGRNIIDYKRNFGNGYMTERTNILYWFEYEEDGNVTYGVSYRTDAFIYWLNKVKFNKGKNVARLIEVPKTPPKKTIKF